MQPWRHRRVVAMTSGGGAAAFSPLDISGLQLWLDASQIVGLNDGDPVGTWPDSSGNGRDFTQATGSSKPVYKTNIRGTLPAVLFDGVDDHVEATFSCTAKTIVTVYKVSGGTQYSRPYDFAPSNKCIYRDASDTAIGAYNGGFGPTLSGASTGFRVATYTFDASTSGLRVDGVTSTPVPGVWGTALFGNHSVGAEASGLNPLLGYVSHVLLYDSLISAQDALSLENYFATH